MRLYYCGVAFSKKKKRKEKNSIRYQKVKKEFRLGHSYESIHIHINI